MPPQNFPHLPRRYRANGRNDYRAFGGWELVYLRSEDPRGFLQREITNRGKPQSNLSRIRFAQERGTPHWCDSFPNLRPLPKESLQPFFEGAFRRALFHQRLEALKLPLGRCRIKRFEIREMLEYEPLRDSGPRGNPFRGWSQLTLLDEIKDRVDYIRTSTIGASALAMDFSPARNLNRNRHNYIARAKTIAKISPRSLSEQAHATPGEAPRENRGAEFP